MQLKSWHIFSLGTAALFLAAPVATSAIAPGTDQIAQTASQYVGKTTAAVGSWVDPKVSCAAATWSIFHKTGITIPKTAAVTTDGGLVKILRDVGWKDTPRSSARSGCVVWHDKNGPGAHGPEHVGICSNTGCTMSFNTKGGLYVNDNYPDRYRQWIDGGDRNNGGVLCPAN
jgi:hypothetical protein